MPYIQIDSFNTTRTAPTFLSRLAAMLLVAAGFVVVAAFVIGVGIFGLAMWVAGLILKLVSLPFKALDRLMSGGKTQPAQPGPERRWDPLGMGDQGVFGWTTKRARPIFRTFVVRNGYAGAAQGPHADGESPDAQGSATGSRAEGDGQMIDLEQDESGRWK